MLPSKRLNSPKFNATKWRSLVRLSGVNGDLAKKRVHMACPHAYMFATCLFTCLNVKRYRFTDRNMALQKPRGVASLVSLLECGFFFWV